MLLIFGLGMSAKVAFDVIRGVIPVMLFTTAAVKNIPPVSMRTARVLPAWDGVDIDNARTAFD